MARVVAHLRYCPAAPRKARLVADMIRGKRVTEAQQMLSLSTKRVARSIARLLHSAAANAEQNFSLDKNTLHITSLVVNDGPILKRYQPRARGRATPLRRRRSHITVVLESQ